MASSSQPSKTTNLDLRLQIARDTYDSLRRDLSWLKQLRSEKSAQISRVKLQLNLCQVEVDFARYNNCEKDYSKNVAIRSDLDFEKERYDADLEGFERKIRRFSAMLKGVEQEIVEMEKMVEKPKPEGDRSPPWI